MCNVLVIDDENFISDLLHKALTIYGYTVATASGGYDGLRMFEEGSFDLVITDINMPDIDGIEVAKSIRRSNKPHTPIIAMSGTPWVINDNGFDCTIAKPFSMKVLMDTVKALTFTPLNSDTGHLNTRLSKVQ